MVISRFLARSCSLRWCNYLKWKGSEETIHPSHPYHGPEVSRVGPCHLSDPSSHGPPPGCSRDAPPGTSQADPPSPPGLAVAIRTAWNTSTEEFWSALLAPAWRLSWSRHWVNSYWINYPRRTEWLECQKRPRKTEQLSEQDRPACAGQHSGPGVLPSTCCGGPGSTSRTRPLLGCKVGGVL